MSSTTIELAESGKEASREYTPEDLLNMPDGDRYELVDGKLVERDMGAEASEIAGNAIRLLGNHVYPNKLGKVFPTDCGYQIFPSRPRHVRFPDGSFVERGRLPDNRTPRGFMRIFPDLALEVLSPTNVAEEVEAKRIEFMEVGTRLFWIIYPDSRTVHVYRANGTARVLTVNDELTGEDVLPGFKCKVAELFED